MHDESKKRTLPLIFVFTFSPSVLSSRSLSLSYQSPFQANKTSPLLQASLLCIYSFFSTNAHTLASFYWLVVLCTVSFSFPFSPPFSFLSSSSPSLLFSVRDVLCRFGRGGGPHCPASQPISDTGSCRNEKDKDGEKSAEKESSNSR